MDASAPATAAVEKTAIGVSPNEEPFSVIAEGLAPHFISGAFTVRLAL